MQKIANSQGRIWGISVSPHHQPYGSLVTSAHELVQPKADYNLLEEEQQVEIDRVNREQDDRIERDLGFRPRRGPDRQVLPDENNNLQFSMGEVFDAIKQKFSPGARGGKVAPPARGRVVRPSRIQHGSPI